jgi:indolepyruvate ferredoxin oxidoreductase beta subunit
MTQPLSLLLCALGGEGGGVLADWLVAVARQAGHAVQATSIPGVAQRTGATTYYLEIMPTPSSALGARQPVLGLNPLPGRLDALVSSELLETARQIGLGMVSSQRTLVISASNRTLTTSEKMVMGDGRRDEAGLLQLLAAHSRRHHVLDMGQLSREAGTVVSAVMLGCIAASGLLPFTRAHYDAVLTGDSASARASRKGFELAFAVIEGQGRQQHQIEQLLVKGTATPETTAPASLPASVAAQFPAAVHEVLALGHARMLEYQGAGYARLYVQRLARILQAEQGAAHGDDAPVTREAARWLALWMAFDDIMRVADLKSRASRWARVRQEVRAGPHDVLKVYDHFKPGIPEIAGLLPSPLATRLLRWDEARVARGQAAWAVPIKVARHSVVGQLALRVLASLRVLRPLGSRYAQEQALIEEWLGSLQQACAQSPQLALEIARCGQLIKGYGSTHARGQQNLLHILRHLGTAHPAPAVERAQVIARVREAALQDEAGRTLDQTLVQHGAPAREPKAQPIRWMRNPRTGKT